MTTTHLLISLGTTICVGIFLYFYLKKRTEKIEKKVNLMFQLIQEHEKQARQQAHIMISQKLDPPINPVETGEPPNVDLISVSDDDSDYEADSDDSAEVSDNENNKITISNTHLKAPLALNGAEITSKILTFSIDEKNNLENTEVYSLTTENEVHSDEESVENNSEGVKVIELGEATEDDLDEITLEEPEQIDNTSKDDDAESNSPKINYAEMKEEVDNLVQNITLQKKLESIEIKPINVSEDPDLRKLRVRELKVKCGELGLEGYKSLRKNALIELIEANLK